MSKKKLNGPATRYVTRAQLVAETTALAQAFALSLNEIETRLEETEARLRAEFTPPRERTLGEMVGAAMDSDPTYLPFPARYPEIVPTDSEGAEA